MLTYRPCSTSNKNNTHKLQLFGNSDWLLYSDQTYLGMTKKKQNSLLSHVCKFINRDDFINRNCFQAPNSIIQHSIQVMDNKA